MSGSSTSSLIVAGALLAGKFKLDALIGEGGMGSVWSATHMGLGQPVAIKFISRDFVRSEEALRRFDSEARAAAQLRSRHVVQVYDTGTLEDGTPYIAMELLHGETLQSRIHRGGPVQLTEAIDILSQCGKALGRAHAAGIIHRDIKPDNIFLAQSNDDDSALVKILDFGVAKMGGTGNEQAASQGSTRTGAVLGTPLYMSPEQARGLKNIDQRTDLYSLGLVAYTMFTGNLAFSSESFGDLLLQICTAPLPSLSASAAWLPPSVDMWFQKACAREPEHRFASAQEFVDGLRTAAGVTLQSPRGSQLPDVAGSGVGPYGQPSGAAIERPAFASTGGGTSPGISRSGGDDYTPPGGVGKRTMGIVGGLVAVIAALGIGIVVVGKGKPSASTAGVPPVAEGATAAVETRDTAGPKPSAPATAASLEALPSLAPPPSTAATAAPHETHERVTGTFTPPPHSTASKPPTGPAPTATATAAAHHGTAAGAATVDLGY